MNRDKAMLARDVVDALELRRLRDNGKLDQQEYTDRLGSAAPEGQLPRLPSALEILERCAASCIQQKSA